jgi:hypothetical protein
LMSNSCASLTDAHRTGATAHRQIRVVAPREWHTAPAPPALDCADDLRGDVGEPQSPGNTKAQVNHLIDMG